MPSRALALALLTLPALAEPAPGLIIYHAGSVSALFTAAEALFTQRTGIAVHDVKGGSVSLARQITAGGQPCDLYAGADYEVIDRMLKPAGFADFSIRFAGGAMVLAYRTTSRHADTIAKAGLPFAPPGSVPDAAEDWYRQLAQPGVRIAGGHPFLDPGAYRADLIFQLAQAHYRVPNLYDALLTNYVVGSAPGTFDFQFTYEHGAQAAAKADTTGTYRYVKLPDEVNLGAPALEAQYARSSVTLPGLQSPGAAATATLPGSRVAWGVALLNQAPHRDSAVAFLRLLCSDEVAGLMKTTGPAPIHPAVVAKEDIGKLPEALKGLVQAAQP